MRSDWSLDQDITSIVDGVGDYWSELRGARIFVTGGTGFIGRWLLESLRVANERHRLGIEAVVLTRNPGDFYKRAPHLGSYPNFYFITGDVCEFKAPEGEFTHLIHGATDASAHLNEHNPLRMFDTIVNGTRNILEFASNKQVGRTLFMSSGAVYGQQPWELEYVTEDYQGAPNLRDARAAYGEGKRAGEMLCAIYAKQFGVAISIARIFALLGPLLELGIHFAAGNFIRDAIDGRPIVVQGDGKACRSYLYISDLTIWLWHLLIRGEPGKPYNVGSEETISIRELAQRVSQLIGTGEYKVLGNPDKGWNPGRYVPDNRLVGRDLRLYRSVSLDDAIRRTALFNGWKGMPGR